MASTYNTGSGVSNYSVLQRVRDQKRRIDEEYEEKQRLKSRNRKEGGKLGLKVHKSLRDWQYAKLAKPDMSYLDFMKDPAIAGHYTKKGITEIVEGRAEKPGMFAGYKDVGGEIYEGGKNVGGAVGDYGQAVVGTAIHKGGQGIKGAIGSVGAIGKGMIVDPIKQIGSDIAAIPGDIAGDIEEKGLFGNKIAKSKAWNEEQNAIALKALREEAGPFIPENQSSIPAKTIGMDMGYDPNNPTGHTTTGENVPIVQEPVKQNMFQKFKQRQADKRTTKAIEGSKALWEERKKEIWGDEDVKPPELVSGDGVLPGGSKPVSVVHSNPKAIQTALQNIDIGHETLIVPYRGVKFGKDGQNTKTRGILMQVQNGKYCTVYPFELAVCKLKYPMPAIK